MFLRTERRGRPADRGGSAKAIETGGRRDAGGAPGGAALEGVIVPARQAKAPDDRSRSVWVGVGLAAAWRVVRSRRFAELAAVSGIVAVALTQLVWAALARVVRGVVAWDNARLSGQDRQPAQAPAGAMPTRSVTSPPRAPNRQRSAVVLGVGLVTAGRTLRNIRFEEQMIVGGIVLAALARMSRGELTRVVRDWIARNDARLAATENKVRRRPKGKVSQRPAS